MVLMPKVMWLSKRNLHRKALLPFIKTRSFEQPTTTFVVPATESGEIVSLFNGRCLRQHSALKRATPSLASGLSWKATNTVSGEACRAKMGGLFPVLFLLGCPISCAG